MAEIRRGAPQDLPAIAGIQATCPEAAHWPPADYLAHELQVAVEGTRIAGFLAARATAPEEYEVLNLAVAPEFRRRGVARALLAAFLKRTSGAVFLEVRASNAAAISLYKSFNFQQLGTRPGYYESPPEAAIVMKYHSC